MAGLIDPKKMKIVRATHTDGGRTLHEANDCPRDWRCPVYVDFHPEVRLQELYFHLEHVEAGDRYMAWYGQLRAKGLSHSQALQGTINEFRLSEQEWYKVRLEQLEAKR